MKRALAFASLHALLVAGCAHDSMPPSPTSPSPQASAATPSDDRALWLVSYAAATQAEEIARGHEKTERWDAAGRAWARAAEESDRWPSSAGLDIWVRSATNFARAQAPNSAFTMLEAAADRGYRWPKKAAGIGPLAPLLETERGAAILARFRRSASTYFEAHHDPHKAALVFDDVDRFWRAYDSATAEASIAAKAAVFRREYFQDATPGLVDYLHLKIGTAEALVRAIAAHRAFYESVRQQTADAERLEPEIRRGLVRLAELVPGAASPDVTFVVGRVNSGGTAGPTGMLVGLEIWAKVEPEHIASFSPGMRTFLASTELEFLPWVVVHEHVHTLQEYADDATLLASAISEGSADFIAQLALPEMKAPYYYHWGLEHEAQVWERFSREMDGNEVGKWIANLSQGTEDWSADLGYFVGARICERYYAQADDKEQALRDLLNVTDARALLDKSGYAAAPKTGQPFRPRSTAPRN